MPDTSTEPLPKFRRRTSWLLAFLRCMVWMLCFIWTAFMLWGSIAFEDYSAKDNQVRDELQSVIFMIGGYLLASCFDKATRCWDP